jgi:hypothetical protein
MYARLPAVAILSFRLSHRPMFTNGNAPPDPRHHAPLLSIGPRRCRYIVSDGTRDAICCGAPTTSDLSSWCAYHSRLVYEPRLTRPERGQGRKAA